MLSRVVSTLVVAALLCGHSAGTAKPGPPPGQSNQDSRPPDDQAPPRPATMQRAAPAEFAAPQAPPGRIVVLTEHQKRCGAQRGCDLDSRNPCPPCW
jgi:hypothetical protein